ncbi:MAG: hypothetical protein RIC19_20070 [Phaeodactylibacter sp.]|uniref:hypothetical protein n=1 Tax=Phaeodactylibacter sp. TaxID=1940289 RepID=UPI0032ED6280
MQQPPYIEVPDSEGACWGGWPAIGHALQQHLQRMGKVKTILAVECYPGTYANIDMGFLKSALSPNVVCRAEDLFLEENDIRQRIGAAFAKSPRADANLPTTVASYFDPQKLSSIQETIAAIETGVILVHGVGAHLVATPDVLVYSDVSRYELIQRLRRKDITNIGVDNRELSHPLQYAWSYFIDWPLGDHIKQELLPNCDYVLETNNWQRPKMVEGDALRRGFELALQQPLSPSPFFDPELWDGQGNRNNPGELSVNFHLRMEEDNLLFKICDQLLETPVVNLLFCHSSRLLGPEIRDTYGDRLPFYIQFFDHLQQQLHDINYYPTPAAMVEHFGKTARHQDYYYAVKARKNATLLAGGQAGTAQEQTVALNLQEMPSEKRWSTLLQALPVKQGAVVAIPSGMLHSTGTGCQLLNIGIATPFFRQQLISKKTGQQPHLSIPAAPAALPLQSLPPQSGLTQSLDAEPYEDHFLRLHQLPGGTQLTLPGTGKVRAICIAEGQTAQLNYGQGQTYQLQFGQVVLLPAMLEQITWNATKGTQAVLIEIRPGQT